MSCAVNDKDIAQLTNREYITAGADNQLNFQDYESTGKNNRTLNINEMMRNNLFPP